MTKNKVIPLIKEALEAIHEVERVLHETGDYEHERLDKAFSSIVTGKTNLQIWLKDNTI